MVKVSLTWKWVWPISWVWWFHAKTLWNSHSSTQEDRNNCMCLFRTWLPRNDKCGLQSPGMWHYPWQVIGAGENVLWYQPRSANQAHDHDRCPPIWDGHPYGGGTSGSTWKVTRSINWFQLRMIKLALKDLMHNLQVADLFSVPQVIHSPSFSTW